MSTLRNRSAGKPTGVSADLMKAPARWANVLLLSIVVTVVAAVVWAWWAELDEVTASTGQVVPASRIQLVQNLEGGIVSEIIAEEGQRITKGDLLLRIDPTGFGSLLNESRERQAGMLAAVARLTAEAKGSDLAFPASLPKAWPDLIVRERALFSSRREELEANLTVYREQVRQRFQEVLEIENQIQVLKRSLALAEEELELMRPAVREGVISRVELIRGEARVNDLRGSLSSATLSLPRVKAALAEAEQRLTERESQFRSTALAELNKTEVELSALAQSIAAQQDRVSRTEVRSPMDGSRGRISSRSSPSRIRFL
jgi:membrane fusion protein, adhesin transport system